MAEICLYLDTLLTPYYKKTHCGIYLKEIPTEHFCEFCLSKKYRNCPYFIKFCKKVFADDEEFLEKLKESTEESNTTKGEE